MTSAAEFVSEEHESCVLQNENWNYKFSQVLPQWDIRIFDYLPYALPFKGTNTFLDLNISSMQQINVWEYLALRSDCTR